MAVFVAPDAAVRRAISFAQSLSTSATAVTIKNVGKPIAATSTHVTLTLSLGAGKVVSITTASATTISREVGKLVSKAATLTASVIKAIPIRVNAYASVAAHVLKDTGKPITTVVGAATRMSRGVGFGITTSCQAFVTWFAALLRMVSRNTLQDPVDCVVEWQRKIGEPDWTEHNVPKPNTQIKVIAKSGGNLDGGKPSFTVTKNNRGYD